MSGTFYFIHGTGAQNDDENRARIERMLAASPYFRGWRTECSTWGSVVGSANRPISPALPDRKRYQAEIATFDATTEMESFAAQIAEEAQLGQGEIIAQGAIQDWFIERGLRVLTNAIEDHRLWLTQNLVDFIRNVFFFLAAGDKVREHIEAELDRAIASSDGPVVVAGHSLGGIIGVDVLSRTPRRVDLLVTAGSQSPLFYLMDAMSGIGPNDNQRAPFHPWANIYNPRDPLAFCASRVFDWSLNPPKDLKITKPKYLLGTHTEYFDQSRLYELIGAELQNL